MHFRIFLTHRGRAHQSPELEAELMTAIGNAVSQSAISAGFM